MAALDNIASELLKSANEADLIYKRTRDQAQRDKAVRLRRIVENLKAISAGGLTPTLDEVLTEGNVSTNTLNVGGITSDYFQLDTAATPTPVQGMMFWDSDRSTVDVQLDADVSAKIGQDNFWYVKNQSGATIPKGKAVMAVGTLGASGRILIDEMVANGSISSKFLLGITAEDIANGADGFVMNIGKLRQVNTTIWPDGTVLYCDPTTAGNLTSTKPSSPNLALPVAFVVHSAVNGVLAIRVSILDENAFNTPTLAQVTTAGNTTTNAITVGGLTVATNLIYTDTVNSRVGFGTLTPFGKVDVKDGEIFVTTSTNANLRSRLTYQGLYISRASDGTYQEQIISTSSSWAYYSRNNHVFYRDGTAVLAVGQVGASAYMTINTTGNVLINTTTDAGYKLDVAGTGRFTNNLSINKSYNLTWGTNQQINVTDYPSYFSGGYNVMSFISTSSGSYADDGSFVWRNAGTSKNLMVLTGVGNLGLGTTNPTDKIHIVDNTNGNKFARISAGGTDASAAWVAQNDQVDNIVYRVFGSAVTGSQMGQALARSASLIANLGGTGKFLIGSFSSTDLIFGTSDQARMRLVDATGNFLIGTMTDTGNKLTVSGNIDAQGYKVNNVLGYTGILNIPTNPPGQQNIDIQGGIVINIF